MKSRILTCSTAMTLFAALAIPVRLAAQEQKEQKADKPQQYTLIDLGTFGGPGSFVGFNVAAVNNQGTVVGGADTPTPNPYYPNDNPLIGPPDPFVLHAFQWQKGVLTELGALPGGQSSAATWINARGEIASLSENGVIDPLVGFPEIDAVLCKDGQITNLGTLGGNQSFATAMNNRGQVVGFAQNAIPDPFSLFGLGTQTRAFLWQNGVMHDLGTLGDGPDSFAAYVNQRS